MSSHAEKISRRFSSVICCTALCILIFGGCEVKPAAVSDELSVRPAPDSIGALTEEAGQSLAAAGGLDAWSKTGKIYLECVATFYQEDGTFYLTEQTYEIYPWSNSMRVSGVEPAGEYLWQMLEGRFGVVKGLNQYEGLEVGVDKGCLAEGILNLVTAPVRLLDKDVEFRWSSEPVRLGGQWYRPAKRVVAGGEAGTPSLRDAAFYQKRSIQRIDMVLLACWGTQGVLVVRGHDYKLLGQGGIMIPTKIEVFSADSGGRVRHRIVQLNVK